jgi:hypothetical protein
VTTGPAHSAFRVKPPVRIPQLFTPEELAILQAAIDSVEPSQLRLDGERGRRVLDEADHPVLARYAEIALPRAREIFGSATLRPSYATYFRYEGAQANLERHRDINANTYSLGCCLKQRVPWALWIEGEPFALHENEAVAYYGNDQEHWREAFPAADDNVVAMIFFFYVEPEHWYFAKGSAFVMTRRQVQRARAAITDPDHRLFLELLNAAWTPGHFYELVRARFPGEDPIEKALGWVDELCARPGPLGIVLNASMRRVAHGLAEGRPLEAIAAAVNEHRRVPATIDDLRQAELELRTSVLAMLFP